MSMIKYLISGILCLLSTCGYGQGQLVFPPCESASFSCPDYQEMLNCVYDLLENEQGFEAYDQFQLLESCDDCPEHQELLDKLGREVLDGVARIVDEQNQAQLAALREEYEKNQIISRRLQATNELIAQQLSENERVTRNALATNYMEVAKEKIDQYDDNGYDAALWLTDYTYAYIDSTHDEVQKMMYRLFYQRMTDNLPYTFYDDLGYETGTAYFDESITAMAWNSDSLWLAIGTSLNQVFILSGEGEILFDFSPDTGTEIFSLDWNRSGNMLAIASSSKVDLITYQKKQWQQEDQPIYRDDYVRVVRWSPNDSHELAIAGDENTIFVYERDWEEPKTIFPSVHRDWIRALDWSSDGDRLASGDDNGRIVLWEYNESNIVIIDNQIIHDDYVRSLDWHPKGDTIASAADNGVIFFQDGSGKIIDDQSVHDLILKLAYSPSGNQLGVLSIDNNFSLLKNNLIEENVSVPANVMSFDWLGEDNTAMGGGLIENILDEDGQYPSLSQVSTSINDEFDAFELSDEYIYLAKWSPDGEILAYAQKNQLLVKQDDNLRRVILEYNNVYDIDWHPGLSNALPNSNFFATIDSDSTLAVWDAIELYVDKSTSLSTNATVLKWTPDGSELVIGDSDGNLWRYDKNLEFIAKYPILEDQINDLAWSPNSRYLAITAEDKTPIIWDYFQEEEKAHLRGHKDWLHQIIWLNDEELASCGDDQQVIIWAWDDAKRSYEITQRLTELSGSYLGLDVDRGSRLSTLVAGTYNGELGVWQRANGPLDTFELNTTEQFESDFTELNWHPSGGKLLFSSYASIPETINSRLEVEPAFSLENLSFSDRIETKQSRIQYSTLKNHFYLPEIKISTQQAHLLQWSADERLMAFANLKTLEVHDFDARELAHTYVFDQPIELLTFSPDHSWLAALDKNAFLTIWPTEDWQDPIFLSLDNIDIMDWTWSADSRYLAMLTADFELLLYDLSNQSIQRKDLQIDFIGEGVMLFHPSNNQLVYIAICAECYPDEANLYTDSSRLYEFDWSNDDAKAQEIFNTGIRQESNPTGYNKISMHWLDDGNSLVVQLLNEPLYLFEIGSSPRILQEFGSPNTIAGPFHDLVYEYVPMDGTNEPFQSADREYVKFWNPSSGQVERKLLGIRKQLTQHLAISEEAKLVAGLGSPLLLFEGKYNLAQWEPVSLNIWEMEEQTEFLSLPVTGAVSVEFSPRGSYIVLHFNGGRASVWPLDITAIAQFLNNAGKDRFFSQPNNKQVSFQSRIEEWGLERGLDIAPKENMERLIRRESPQLRADWSAFFLEQAWLVDKEEAAQSYFTKALQLHLNKNGTIRESRQDSMAIARIYLDQTYFYLAKEKFSTARRYLRTAQEKLPSADLLDQAAILLSWQEGKQESVFIRMNNQNNDALSTAYEQFIIRDLILRDRLFFERLLSTHLQDWDPAFSLSSMKQLIADFEKTERLRFLDSYYLINYNNSYIGRGERQQLLLEALQFYETIERNILPTDSEAKADNAAKTLLISNELVISFMNMRKYDKALIHSQTSVSAAKTLLIADLESARQQKIYFYNIKRHGILMANQQPDELAPIYSLMAEAETFTKTKEVIVFQFLRGHLAMLENNQEKAQLIYFNILNRLNNDYELVVQASDQIIADLQLLAIDQNLSSDLLRKLKTYESYQLNMQKLERLIQERSQSPNLFGEYLVNHLETSLSISKAVISEAQALLNSSLVSLVTYETQVETYYNLGSELAWLYLQNNDFELAQLVAEQSKNLFPDSEWPTAIVAVILSVQQDSPGLKKVLVTCRSKVNDGYNTEMYPTLKQLLSIPNLPENISQHSNFLINESAWRDGLN